MTYDFSLSCTLPASPEAVYDAWQDNYFAPMKAYFAGAKTNGRRAGKPAGTA